MEQWKGQDFEGQSDKADSWQFRVNQVFVQRHHPTALNSHLTLWGQEREVEFVT
jgi:hypothetical protein